MVILDSDPCRADSVRVTPFVPHLPDGIDYLVEAVDEVTDAAMYGCVGVDVVELLGLREQFSHIAACRGNLSFALYDLAEGLLEQRPRFGEGAVAIALLDVAVGPVRHILYVRAVDDLDGGVSVVGEASIGETAYAFPIRLNS